MIEQKYIDSLLQSELFDGFEQDELVAMLENWQYKIVHYAKNDVLALSGDKCNQLIIVVQGNLVTHMVSESGKFVQIDKIGEGRVVAPAMLFATDNVFPVNVTPEDMVTTFTIHKSLFMNAIYNNEKLLFNFIRIISNINRFLSDKIHFLTLKSIRGKIAGFLLSLAKKQNLSSTVTIPLTRQELANKFGVSRQSLIRSLSELENEGLIEIQGKAIMLIDKIKLRQVD